MVTPRDILDRFERGYHFVQLAGSARTLESREVELNFPPDTWISEDAAEMLQIATEASHKLARVFEIPWPKQTACYVADLETIRKIQHYDGAAYDNAVVIGVEQDHMSSFAQTVTHELAHILSHEIGKYECKFKGEGFACFANWVLDPNAITGGLPLHYHLVWMRHVGIDCSLEYLWSRRDYTVEIYDLAWSFAAFCAERYGMERYLKLYGSSGHNLDGRLRDSLGEGLATVEREWYRLAEGRIEGAPAEIARMDRCAGVFCRRAAWIRDRT